MIGVLVLEPPCFADEATRRDLTGRGGRGGAGTRPGPAAAAAAEDTPPAQQLAPEVRAQGSPAALGVLASRGWGGEGRQEAGWSIGASPRS